MNVSQTKSDRAEPRVTRFSLLTLALVLLVSADATARPSLSPSNMKRLEKWEVLTFSLPAKGVQPAKAIGRTSHPPEALLYAVMDLAKYKFFLPHFRDSRIVKKRGRVTRVVLETKFPWPVKDAWVYAKVSYHPKPGGVYEVDMKMLNGTMKRFNGRILIEPWSKAEPFHSVITFMLDFEPSTRAPNATLTKGVRKIVETFVHRLRLRVKALRKYGKLPKNLEARFR